VNRTHSAMKNGKKYKKMNLKKHAQTLQQVKSVSYLELEQMAVIQIMISVH